jgi:hypothetical protein
MAIVAPSGDGTNKPIVKKNNGGTVVNGGNVPTTSPFTKNIALTTFADDRGQSFGSKVVANDGTGNSTTDRVGVSGTYVGSTGVAYKAGRTEWVIRGISTTLGGRANTVLLNKGNQYDSAEIRDNIFENTHTHALGSGTLTSINIFARPSGFLHGELKKGGNAGYEVSFGTDEAAAPTRGVPGELTYRTGAKLPVQDNYKAKDTRET